MYDQMRNGSSRTFPLAFNSRWLSNSLSVFEVYQLKINKRTWSFHSICSLLIEASYSAYSGASTSSQTAIFGTADFEHIA
jgi:hypothetical protein